MKINDLKRYKPLDITELSGSPWNTADKVLGLDENDKVVMAEPEEGAVTPEYVDNAIDQAMEAETARTESTYLKEHQSLDDYYTKEEVDQAIEDVEVDLSNYYTKAEVDEAIENVDVSDQLVNYALTTAVTQDIQTAIANETARTENTYAKPSDIPSLDGYAKTTAVTQDIQTAMASETARTEDVYAKKSEVPDLDDYYTKSETDEAIEEAISGISLEGYWTSAETKNYVDSEITGATASETARTESTYAKKSEIPSLDGYATEQYVDEAIADIPQVDLSAYAKTTAVTEDIQTAMGAETARTEDAYVKKSLYTGNDYKRTITRIYSNKWGNYDCLSQWYVEPAGNARGGGILDVFFKHLNGESIIASMSEIQSKDNIELPTFSDVSTAITDAIASETARTESAYAKKSEIPSLDGYWTSAQTENAITAATEDMATETWVGQQGYLTQHQDISGKLDVSVFTGYTGATETVLDGKADISDIPDVSGFVTSGEVATQIGTAMASETARTESTYLKEHQDISGKLDKTDFNTYTGATATALDGKVDLTTYTAYTGSTATAIAAKQDTLVSGTNIKTINNQSLLGSGNIDIQGGGGGGDNVVELTKAQYEALNPPAADTTYIITDADVVDLNDYAPASGLTELSGTVETLSSTKADAANVTARNTNWIPGWNNQGIITGGTEIYTGNINVNGTSKTIYQYSSGNLGTIYGPVTAGAAGQPLLSNGSGAPVWGGYKFAFITQTAYDDLATKDATTIYFIVGD